MSVAEKQVAVVTGAGQGLGRALLAALADRGLAVAGIARGAPGKETPALFVEADVGDPEAVARAFGEIRQRLGTPDILINNAAVYPRRDILDETPESFADTVRINLGGAFNCCHAVLPNMVARGRGRIINVATFADIRPAPLSAAYSVSKGAMRILTRSLLADLGDRFPDILINDWIPGALRTRIGLADGIDPAVAAKWGVALALLDDRSINGMVFDRNYEFRPARSFKQRLKERVLGQARPRLRLD